MPTLNRKETRELLREGRFEDLFVNSLGWDIARGGGLVVEADGEEFMLMPVAQKRDFAVYSVNGGFGRLPSRDTQLKISREAGKTSHEHMIIFVSSDGALQHWQWVRRGFGRPVAQRRLVYRVGSTGEPLIQKLERIAFEFAEEDSLTVTDVEQRVRATFDVDVVTSGFFKEFKKRHDAFLDQIDGMRDDDDRKWYASIMLNRLMFVYFIQKKGFLDKDQNYLSNKLRQMQGLGVRNGFYPFYRCFLLRLFHEGLSKPPGQRRQDVVGDILGEVPYLNGGLFAVHQLEEKHTEINIPDCAFGEVFDFFDKYKWHLDERALRKDNEINPDVLGYIFQKYITDREKGAYYTKEDVTEYMSRNAILPAIFDKLSELCPERFGFAGSAWDMLKSDPDRYVFESLRHGFVFNRESRKFTAVADVPPELKNWKAEDSDNLISESPPPKLGLAGERWIEWFYRRERYERAISKLSHGEVRCIDNFITLNLDIQKFMNDVIVGCSESKVLLSIWNALKGLSVLDPTCGSGAFLFAALNVLEPVYLSCFEAMEECAESQREGDFALETEELEEIKKVVEDARNHARLEYFILKQIMLNNLYGVDLMEEAVEICKLRMFLKLIAQLDSVESVEPLPDIDFNFRSGNALVGFINEESIEKILGKDLVKRGKIKKTLRMAEQCQNSFLEFKALQTVSSLDVGKIDLMKRKLKKNLNDLRKRLDENLFDPDGARGEGEEGLLEWSKNTSPFHWLAEHYGIMSGGGFDVIIGNPPYVKATPGNRTHDMRDFKTFRCTDIYAWVLERTAELLRDGGRTAMIVPLSLAFNKDFSSCRGLMKERYSVSWHSHFGIHPGGLFEGVIVRNTIHIGRRGSEDGPVYTTKLHLFKEISGRNEEYCQNRPRKAVRQIMFETLNYIQYDSRLWDEKIPKPHTERLLQAFESMLARGGKMAMNVPKQATKHRLRYKTVVGNWLTFCEEFPDCEDDAGNIVGHTQAKDIYFRTTQSKNLSMPLLNGKLMLAWWYAVGDEFHLNQGHIISLPLDIDVLPAESKESVGKIRKSLLRKMKDSIIHTHTNGRYISNYDLRKCRDVTDESDQVFLKELGLGDVWHDVKLAYFQQVGRYSG